MVEERRDIEGYEGLYQVSNLGRVRSLDRILTTVRGDRLYKGVILKLRVSKDGYDRVMLRNNKVIHEYLTHRLVAEAFIPNSNNYPIINHKDEDRLNNCVENLEWCDIKYNVNYGTGNIRRSTSLKGRVFSDEHRKHISESLMIYNPS